VGRQANQGLVAEVGARHLDRTVVRSQVDAGEPFVQQGARHVDPVVDEHEHLGASFAHEPQQFARQVVGRARRARRLGRGLRARVLGARLQHIDMGQHGGHALQQLALGRQLRRDEQHQTGFLQVFAHAPPL
jgi:hypothetical protein